MGHRPSEKRLRFLVSSAFLLVAVPAAAQVATDQRRCIVTINSGVRTVARAEHKALRTCARSLTSGTLVGHTVAECATARVGAIVAKTLTKTFNACGGVPPSFGPPSLTAQTGQAVDAVIALAGDVLGSPLDAALLALPEADGCQKAILTALQQCEDVRLREFVKCKKNGLGDGTITDAAGLAACLGAGPAQPDAKGTIARQCAAKTVDAVQSRCAGVALADVATGCNAADASTLGGCMDARTRCRVCVMLNAVDGLARDCDVVDDGDDANDSCPEPTVCGDGVRDGTETCDDGNTTSGDGCDASCRIETGYACSGTPSACATVCGDGLVVAAETCDDGNATGGDGCSAACRIETGYACIGLPSICRPVCGDGLIVGGEPCDDGNTATLDGCDAVCHIEPGWVCTGQPSDCTRSAVVITSPLHGSFSQASTATVTGFITALAPGDGALTINGNLVPIAPDRTFTTTVPLDAVAIFNPIRATLTQISTGAAAHDRVVVIRGASVADGALSPQAVALRLNDSGLDRVEPLIGSLAGAGLNLAQLVPVGTVLINNQCFVDSIFGCLGRATVKISNPPPSFSSFALAADSMTNFVKGDITVNNIRVDVFLDGSGVVPDCPITIRANQAFFKGNYSLEPDAADRSNIDVNQLGALDVSFTNFTTSFGGLCDAPIIGDIIQAFLPNVESLTINAMRNFLNDPDGSGPQDSPTANAFESALAGVSIAGPVGAGLGVMLAAPLFEVAEDVNGITFGSDASFTVHFGTGTGQCVPPPGAPNLTASLAIPQTFPTFGTTTPVSHTAYDVGIGVSSSGMNQLLRAKTECGLLVTTVRQVDLGGGPLNLNAFLLSVLMPQFAAYPPATPFRIDIRPTLAPILTGATGPGGELAELKIAQVTAAIVRDDGSEEVALLGTFDATMGMNLQFSGGQLGVTVTPPAPGAITATILDNPLGVDEINLETSVLPPLVSLLLPDLAGSLASFPLPGFFGLSLNGVEVSRTGQFLSLYANLVPNP